MKYCPVISRDQLGRRIVFSQNSKESEKMWKRLDVSSQRAISKYWKRVTYTVLLSKRFTIWRNLWSPQLEIRQVISNLLKKKFVNLGNKVGRFWCMGVEVLEHWQSLKVHEMLFERYWRKERTELFTKKIKSVTGVQRKTTSC